ncbi:MAG: universal stress protein [Acidimicrobiales bacterium]
MTASDPSFRKPAGPYGHVLVGTDGSASAREAVRHAAELALAASARLTIVSAYSRRPADEAVSSDEDAWMVSDAAGAEEHVVKAQDLVRDLGLTKLGGRTENGDPAAVMLDIAEELGVDVIVVGSRGMATASRFVLGSVPNRVSHHARCDVIIVRTGD